MSGSRVSRREWLAAAVAGSTVVAHAMEPPAPGAATSQRSDSDAGQRRAPEDGRGQAVTADRADEPPFQYCLNMSTIRGQKLSVPDQVDLAAKAGYDAIEPWMGDLTQYVQQGGSVSDLRKRIEDAGLTVASAIGFAEWIVDDDSRRSQGLENARRDMDLLRQIGGVRIAAPPTGATKQPDLNLFRAAERYRTLLELGAQMDVTPQLELWGFSLSMSRLGELLFVAAESGHPQACVLPDVYHIYKGGSDFAGLRLLNGRAVHVFHMNDYPAQPKRDTISDADRVYPGDGIAPLASILRGLEANGFRGALSLELFNRQYWAQDPLQVARTGLEKMRAAVAASLAS
ncbi:MAG: sugar phosphate isomerase/epimerase family protein [Pirellulaceae bacterium]